MPDTEIIKKKNEILDALDNDTSVKKLMYLYIDYILLKKRHNKVHASRVLGIDRRTIQRMIRDGYVTDEYTQTNAHQVQRSW